MKWNESELESWRNEKTVVRCESRYDYHLDGFIEGWSERWILIRLIGDGLMADGYSAMRRRSLKSIGAHVRGRFFAEAIALRRQSWPALTGDKRIDLEKAATIITSAFVTFPLVTIYQERIDPDSCNIGCHAIIEGGALCWRDITPHAELEEKPLWLKDVTRIAFGGLYEDALWQVYSDRRRTRIVTMEQ